MVPTWSQLGQELVLVKIWPYFGHLLVKTWILVNNWPKHGRPTLGTSTEYFMTRGEAQMVFVLKLHQISKMVEAENALKEEVRRSARAEKALESCRLRLREAGVSPSPSHSLG